MHLFNSFTTLSNAKSFNIGDFLDTHAEVTAILQHDSGKPIETLCIIMLNSSAIVSMKSQFLIYGLDNIVDGDFLVKVAVSSQMHISSRQITLLTSKKWLLLDEIGVDDFFG